MCFNAMLYFVEQFFFYKQKESVMTLKKWSVFLLWSISTLIPAYALADAPQSKATTQTKQASLTPKKALELLKAGNKRFREGNLRNLDFEKEMKVTTKKGQFPLAIFLSCIDSRSIPDVLFDQGLGNIFVSRVAGNVADQDMLGSMEFATKLAGAPLIVVMGHTHCGAVQGACVHGRDVDLKNLSHLLGKIKPAVQTMKKKDESLNCENMASVDKIAKQNVLDQISYIRENSEAINGMAKDNKIMIVGAMHDIRTGEVVFFDEQGHEL